MPPHWFVSMTLRTAGPTWAETMNSSANSEMAGVREIGRRYFEASSTGFCLGNGTTSASFHESGSFCSWKLPFRIEVIGWTRLSA